MTEFKPGDRVKVEFEGRVVRYEGDGFYTAYAAYGGETCHYHENYLTLLGPEEPTGVGAVVRDAEGLTFARHAATDSNDRHLWVLLNSHNAGDLHDWDEISANAPVEVLYEGVQP